jgi:glycosyl transferase, family 25
VRHPARVISLQRTPERLTRFRAVNRHVRADLLQAVDGATVDRVALESSGIIAPNLPYTDGALGNTLSHLAFWDQVIAAQRPMTVFEDDAVVNGQFMETAPTVLAGLPSDWHICLWGFNFDDHLAFGPLPGIATCIASFDQEALRANLDKFRHLKLRPMAYRLLRAFGIVSYALSPAGAKLLRERCLPVPAVAFQLPGLPHATRNTGFDVTLNALGYPHVNAYVCFPPLVVTPNDWSVSTVQTAQPR